MKTRRFLLRAGLGLLFTGGVSLGELLRERPLPLVPAAWEPAAGLQLSEAPGGGLRMRGYEASVSLRLRESLPIGGDTVLVLSAPVNSGELTVQAEWLSPGGEFLGATDLTRFQGPVKGREVAVPAAAEGASAIGLKLWFASDALDATLTSVVLRQRVDWPAGNGMRMTTVATRAPDAAFVADGALKATVLTGCIRLALEKEGNASAHFDQAVPFHADGCVLLAVESVAPRTGLSLQAVFFDAHGAFVGDRPVLADLVQAGDYVGRFAHFAEPPPPTAARVTFKLWLSGEAGSHAVVNGLLYGRQAQ